MKPRKPRRNMDLYHSRLNRGLRILAFRPGLYTSITLDSTCLGE